MTEDMGTIQGEVPRACLKQRQPCYKENSGPCGDPVEKQEICASCQVGGEHSEGLHREVKPKGRKLWAWEPGKRKIQGKEVNPA